MEFGDYEVSLTVPSDHIVAATGELQNANQVLTREQRDRLQEAETADRPVFIVTPAEALENESEGVDDTKTWRFAAENVRDFAWGSSRKFIWDAKGHHQEGADQELVMAMSFYPKEGGKSTGRICPPKSLFIPSKSIVASLSIFLIRRRFL